MRTTLTLDDDVAALLRRLQRVRGGRFKDLVNEALREGLRHMTNPRRKRTPFQTRSVDLGRCFLGNSNLLLNGTVPVGFPWPSLLGFLRLATNPRIFERPASLADAWGQVAAWLDCEIAWIPQPTERHRAVLESLLGAPGNLVPDAHLAALAIEHGLLLQSTDGDFARFPDLRWQNPLSI